MATGRPPDSNMAFVLPFFGTSRNAALTPDPSKVRSSCALHRRIRTTALCAPATTGVEHLRQQIECIAGKHRGIFGLEEEEREKLESLVKHIENNNPNPNPTWNNAQAAAGSWRLLYTTLEILGKKRVRLAISSPRKPGLVKLGNFIQVIDSSSCESKNIIEFKILTGTSGTFTITAKYDVVSNSRVNVSTVATALQPPSFEAMLGQNMPLLTQIFNPDGYLDITYLDESFRIGRDNKGHLFVLERMDS